jgi:hypothetical protein
VLSAYESLFDQVTAAVCACSASLEDRLRLRSDLPIHRSASAPPRPPVTVSRRDSLPYRARSGHNPDQALQNREPVIPRSAAFGRGTVAT